MTRLELTNGASATVKQIKQLIHDKLTDKPKIPTQQLTLNGKSTDTPLQNDNVLSSLNIKHVDILYLKIVSSAIICQSNDNGISSSFTSLPKTTRSSARIRKRKLNDIQTSSIQNVEPPSKRTRFNSTSSNNNNHDHNRNHNNNSSLTVHTISNTQQRNNNNHNNSNNSNNASNTRNNNNNNSRGNRLGSGRSLGSAKNANSKKTEDVKKKLKKKSTKKKKTKKKKDEYLVIKSEGDTISQIVDNYLNGNDNRLNHSLNQLSDNLQSQYSPQARIEAILDVTYFFHYCY